MRTSLYEKRLLASGLTLIAGCDEAGRGALAGPVVAAAVVLDYGELPRGLSDSKQLLPEQREALAQLIRSRARAYSIQRIEAEEIDRINILAASLLAMQRAVEALGLAIEHVLVDGDKLPKGLTMPAEAIVKGDGKVNCIAAASILAKTERDRIMRDYALEHPHYGFESNFAYPTPPHLAALREHGPCALHRRTYAPVRELLQPGLFA